VNQLHQIAEFITQKTNTNLNIYNEKSIGDVAYDFVILSSRVAVNSDILITGVARNYSTNEEDAAFLRITQEGDSVSLFTYGTPGVQQWGHDILEKPDSSGYLFLHS
jgi:hypothetical protein